VGKGKKGSHREEKRVVVHERLADWGGEKNSYKEAGAGLQRTSRKKWRWKIQIFPFCWDV